MALQSTTPQALARQARAQFVEALALALPALSDAIRDRLVELVDQSTSTRVAHERRDAVLEFERLRSVWVEGTSAALRAASGPRGRSSRTRPPSLTLELIDDEVVEKKILASRLSLAMLEKVSWELNDLKLRIQALEGTEAMLPDDILWPDTVAGLLLEAWLDSALSRVSWEGVAGLIQREVVGASLAAYKSVNAGLIAAGVMPEIDLSGRVRRGAEAGARRGASVSPGPEANAPDPDAAGPSSGGSGPRVAYGAAAGESGGWGSSGIGGAVNQGGGHGSSGPYGGNSQRGSGDASSAPGGAEGAAGRAGAGAGAARYAGPMNQGGAPSAGAQTGGAGGAYRPGATQSQAGLGSTDADRVGDWPQIDADDGVTGSAASRGDARGGTGVGAPTASPGAKSRMRAQGVIGQLKRLLVERVAGFDPDHPPQASPALTEAIDQHSTHAQTQAHTHVQTQVGGRGSEAAGIEEMVYDSADVAKVAQELRQRTGELKKKATSSNEKAVIEIVALMFQSILSEERILPAVRVWFARLQMPVLRVALSEPEFFGSLEHPARQLIDRMGACVMGFDGASVGVSALEVEIRRIVQLIEQYPDTGRKVFLLAYDEFKKFLSRFLTEGNASTQRVVSIAQQVEQKETMTVRYTIELRKMLDGMPVRDEIREFLFKVWAEVIAQAAVRHGPQHADTLALKKSASDLVWAASAKPNRAERAQVIQGLPALLHSLRRGMSLLGASTEEQEKHIKIIGDTLADAFQSKTAVIPAARITAIAERLANLEDYLEDEPRGDLPLDAESIELMLGLDPSEIEVVTDGGAKPSAAVMAWARELQPGSWFNLDHNGVMHQVQFAWRSDRGHLHLFASAEGRNFLVQAARLAAYLQAGLLRPTEDEALTVRATRDALAKLDANPERLLS